MDFRAPGLSPDEVNSSWLHVAANSLYCYPATTASFVFASSFPGGLCDSPSAGLFISADADLHNRSELLGTLRSPASCSDACLILAAYERWGEKCPEHLLGEFSFAIWDRSRRRLFCCRDHIGARPFYYWTDGVRFAFSTDPQLLLSVPGIGSRLNYARFIEWATKSPYLWAHREESFHEAIVSIPSATSLTFDRLGLRKQTYWVPDSSSVRLPSTDEESFEVLRSILFEAVRCRVSGKRTPAAFLSGGLDSSALVAIAARCLREENRSLSAFAAVLPDASRPQFEDEREFIEQFATDPNVRIEYVAPETGGPFDRIEDYSAFARGPFRTSRRYLNDALMERAGAVGADVILSGSGGEAGPTTWGRGYYLELAANFRWYTLARELRLRSRREKRSPVRLLGKELLDFLPRDSTFRPVFLIAPDLLLAAENGQSDREFHWPDHRREQEKEVRARLMGHGNISPAGMPRVTQPFMDKRVLEFCLAMPGHMKVRDGYIRYAIRRALQGILPEKIQWRTDKMPFAPDYEKRYRAQLGKAREFVAGIRRKDPVRSIVDIHRLQYLLDHPDSPAGRAEALVRIPASIHLICFLRQFPEFQA